MTRQLLLNFLFLFASVILTAQDAVDMVFEDEATVTINFTTPSISGEDRDDRGLIKLRITQATTGVVYRINGQTFPYTEFPTSRLKSGVERLFASIESSDDEQKKNERITVQIRSNKQNLRYAAGGISPIVTFIELIESEYYLALLGAMEADLREQEGIKSTQEMYFKQDGSLEPPLPSMQVSQKFFVLTKEDEFTRGNLNIGRIQSIERTANELKIEVGFGSGNEVLRKYAFVVEQLGDRFRVESVKII
ncbi:hypothetical protein [Sanyastnella coralliicola]|uniref:hypothetical protein n=1 Tax=Sanyastnella coralliicola TaxID=3069118 RepID=UPI0027BA7E83|nr:hypothetical protein [Longitalea sp. SCSIO 12813]